MQVKNKKIHADGKGGQMLLKDIERKPGQEWWELCRHVQRLLLPMPRHLDRVHLRAGRRRVRQVFKTQI